MTTDQLHEGRTPADCPVCKPRHDAQVRVLDGKVQKVYGRVTRNTKRNHDNAQRHAKEALTRLFKEHLAAMKAQGVTA